jgi:ankyrin repeat protein
MKLIREHINEKFTEDSDPIDDLGIGMDALIKHWVENEHYESYLNAREDLLCICAEHGKTDFVKHLLDKGYDVHRHDDFALRWASEKGHAEVIKVLLEAGANVHAIEDSALRWACENRHADVVKVLLDAGADIHAEDEEPLIYACFDENIEIIKILLDVGADVHAEGDAAMRIAIEKKNNEMIKLLKDHITKEKKSNKKKAVKENLNEKFTEDSDPIHDMGIGIIELMRNFANEIACPYYMDDINDKNKLSNFLVKCAEYNQPHFIEYLLTLGANVEGPPNHAPGSPLRWAIYENNIEVVKVLLKNGANVNNSCDHYKFKEYDLKIRYPNVIPEILDMLKTAALKSKNKINEKFFEDSDPIEDMGIGLRKLIERYFEKYDVRIRDFTLDEKGFINTDDDVDFNLNCNNSTNNEKMIIQFPEYIKFNKVGGHFQLTLCNMISLKGCPRIVKGNFYIGHNNLTSLQYSPIETKSYYCHNNKLTSLKGVTKNINGDFACIHNDIILNSKELPKYVNGSFKHSIKYGSEGLSPKDFINKYVKIADQDHSN